MSESKKNPPHPALTAPLDHPLSQALFDGEIEGIVTTCYQNERPLGGLIGLLDWRFHGAISEHIRTGAFGGAPGECTYIPIIHQNRVFHILAIGCGYAPAYGQRVPVPAESLQRLQKNLTNLKLGKLGISRADFGNIPESTFAKWKAIQIQVT